MKWQGDKIAFEIFGTSHAPEMKIVASGMPRVEIDSVALSSFMERRKARISVYSTSRLEPDEVIFDNTSEDFCAVIKNTNVRSQDYNELYAIPRPSHADYSAYLLDGRLDFSGGGEFSGRLTAMLCALGGVAKQYLAEHFGVQVSAWASEIGGVKGASYKNGAIISTNSWGAGYEDAFTQAVKNVAMQGDSVGGKVECAISGLKGGVCGGMFGSLEGKLSSILYLIPAVKGVEFGAGFDLSKMFGSVANDQMCIDEKGEVYFLSNNAGGINGGISNGNDITLGVVFRPTPSISKMQNSVNLERKENVEISIKGRHDACIVPRAVPVVEAVVAIAILDSLL